MTPNTIRELALARRDIEIIVKKVQGLSQEGTLSDEQTVALRDAATELQETADGIQEVIDHA